MNPNMDPLGFGGFAAMMPQAPRTAGKKKQQGKGGTATSLISEGAGTTGALAGAALGTMVLPVVGTAIGAGLGGLIGGVSGRLAENKIRDDEYRPGDALEEGAISGIMGVGPGRLMQGARALSAVGKPGARTLESAIMEGGEQAATAPLKTSAKGRMVEIGNDLLARQYPTLTAPMARSVDLPGTVAKLADVGIFKPQDAERIAQAVTGSSGIINKAVLTATGGAGKVPVATIPKVAQNAVDTIGLVDNDAKSVMTIVEAQMKRLGEGAIEAEPGKVLEVMKALEKRAADLRGRYGNAKLTDPVREDKAKALLAVKNELQDQLYNAAGANKNLASVLTPELRDQLVKLNPSNPQWQKHVDNVIMKSTDIAGLRGSMSPFVRIARAIDAGEINSVTMGGRFGNALINGGGAANMAMAAGIDLVKGNTASRIAGQGLRKLGGAGPDPAVTAPGTKGIVGRMGLAGGAEAAGATYGAMRMGAPVFGAGMQEGMDANQGMQQPQSLEAALMAQGGGMDAMQQPQGPHEPYGRENLMYDIQRDPKNADKYLAYYQQMQEVFNPEPSAADAPFGKPTVGQYGQASTGMNSLGQLEQMLASDPGVIGRNNAPGQGLPFVGSSVSGALGTDRYRSLTNNLLNSMVRINTGAAMTAEEEDFYRRAYLPQPGDSPEAIRGKLDTLRQFFRPITNYQSQGASLEDALMQGGPR